MLPKRMRISKAASDTLKMLKGRTGVTPNIVCRIALLMSLERGDKTVSHEGDQSGNEFNAPTLFGEHGLLIECLLREVYGQLDPKECAAAISGHIDMGLDLLRKSKNLLELVKYSGLTN